MATLIVNPGTNDAGFDSRSVTLNYANARAGTETQTALAPTATTANVGQRQNTAGSQFFVYEYLLEFDTSALGSSATVSAATLELMLSIDSSTTTDFINEVYLHDWGGGTLTWADFIPGASISGKTLLATLDTNGIGAASAYKTFVNVAFPANVNLTGFTRLAIASDKTRLGTTPADGVSFVTWRTADFTSPPKLTITYTSGPPPNTATAALTTEVPALTATGAEEFAATAAPATEVPVFASTASLTISGTAALSVEVPVLAATGSWAQPGLYAARLTGGGVVTIARTSARFFAVTAAGTPEKMHADSTPTTLGSSGGPYTISMGFTPSADGQITHIRYYDDTGHSSGSHVLSLWNATTGVRLTGTTVGELAAGAWNEVALPTPYSVTAGTTYRASYVVPTWGSFATAYPTSLAPHLAAVGGAWYSLGTDVFPSTAQPTNHYPIDVTFVPTGGAGGMTGGGVITVSYTRATAITGTAAVALEVPVLAVTAAETFTSTAAPAVEVPVLAVTATYTPPAVTSTGAASVEVPVLAITGTNTPPAITGYRDTVMATSNLIGYWRLGESANTQPAADERVLYPGTYTSDGVAPLPTVGQASNLSDGNTSALWQLGQWVTIPHASGLNLGDNWTIEAWINLSTSTAGDHRSILSKGPDSYYLRVGSGGYLELVRANAWIGASSASPLSAGVWHHVAGTKAGTTLKLYLDGADVTGTVANSGVTIDGTYTLLIGADQNPGTNKREGFVGYLDEIALYGRALSAGEILQHFNAASGTATPTTGTAAVTVEVPVISAYQSAPVGIPTSNAATSQVFIL